MEEAKKNDIKKYLDENLITSTNLMDSITDFITNKDVKSIIIDCGASMIDVFGGIFAGGNALAGAAPIGANIGLIRGWIEQQQEHCESFQKLLKRYLSERGYTEKKDYPRFYNKIGMDRRLFSKIMSEKNPTLPEPRNIHKIMIGLELDASNAKKLLESAGYDFNAYKVSDMIVKYCIENGIYGVDTVDEYLYEFGQETLFSEQ